MQLFWRGERAQHAVIQRDGHWRSDARLREGDELGAVSRQCKSAYRHRVPSLLLALLFRRDVLAYVRVLRGLPRITCQREGSMRKMRVWNRSRMNKNTSRCALCSMNSSGDTIWLLRRN